MSILLQASDVSYAHGGNQIFTDISFELKEGDRAALIGENGSGKSTLFRLLARVMPPDSGAVTHKRGVTIGYLTQEPDLDPDTKVGDILAAAAGDPDAMERELDALGRRLAEPLDDDEMTAVLDAQAALLAKLDDALASDSHNEVADTLAALGLSEQIQAQTFGVLSGGEKKLVALARFSMERPDVLLLDEPDNHLDADAKVWLERYLAAYAGAVAVISHDRFLIDKVANEIFELEDSAIHIYPGNYSRYRQLKGDRLQRASELRALQEREMKKLKESAEELTQWARQNPKFATRAENQRRKLAAERERLDATPVPIIDRKRIKVEFDSERGSTIVVHADGAAKRYGDRVILRPFDLVVRHGERVGIVGPNGAGKTTLFRLALGKEKADQGSIKLGMSISAGYYSQEHETLAPNSTPIDVVRRIKPLTEQQALSFLTGFKFDRDDTTNRVSALSGGERSRLQVACLILQGANLLLLDEPTNNLDIPSVEELEEALLDFDGTIVAISHDRYFLEKICGRILQIDGGVVTDYPGNWDYYAANRDKGTKLTRGMDAPVPFAKKVKATVGV